MGQLHIGNTIISYEEKVSARARRIRITVDKDKIIVTIPKGANIEEVRKFVQSKQEWIFKHIQQYVTSEQENPEKPQKSYVAGEKFPFMGREVMLRTITYNDKYTTIKLDANTMWVYIPDSISKEVWPQVVKEAIIYCYKNQAKKIFKQKLDHYAKLMGVKYNEMRVKEQKTRWGSCSSKANINLNWKAIMAPSQVIDYLVIHELAHLKYLNHSKDFWHLVKSFMPDYKSWEKWLKDNSINLVI